MLKQRKLDDFVNELHTPAASRSKKSSMKKPPSPTESKKGNGSAKAPR